MTEWIFTAGYIFGHLSTTRIAYVREVDIKHTRPTDAKISALVMGTFWPVVLLAVCATWLLDLTIFYKTPGERERRYR